MISWAEYRRGDRIKYTGPAGRNDGPEGVIVGISAAGLKVRWLHGTTTRVHPEDVRPMQRQETT